MGLRAGLDAKARRKHWPCRESNPGRPDKSLVTVLTEPKVETSKTVKFGAGLTSQIRRHPCSGTSLACLMAISCHRVSVIRQLWHGVHPYLLSCVIFLRFLYLLPCVISLKPSNNTSTLYYNGLYLGVLVP